MDGIHDLGGMRGFGAIEVEADEPTFHGRWEFLAFAINAIAISVHQTYNVDEYRHAIERMRPLHYLGASYYERTLTGSATLLVEKGVVTREELEERAGGAFPLSQPVAEFTSGDPDALKETRFAVGDRVRVRNMHPVGHTRVPRYVRGARGEVVHVAPAFPFPDAAAHGLPARSEPTYHVLFDASELWSDDADSHGSVIVDLWQTYLEPAP